MGCGASKPEEGLLEQEAAPGKQIGETAPVSSAPEKAAPPPPAAPAAKAASAPAPAPSSSAPAAAPMPARAAAYAPASEDGASPLIARITINKNVEATVAIMTEVEAAGSVATGAGAEAEAKAKTEAEAAAGASRPPSQRSPTDEMSEAEIVEAAALDEEFKKDARARKEQYEATVKVRWPRPRHLGLASAPTLTSPP